MNTKYILFTTYIVIGLLLASLPLGISYLKTNQEYNVFNFNNNGCSNFGKIAYSYGEKIVPLINMDSKYSVNSKDSVLIIISPDIPYSDDEINNMKKFLENGNTVIIADNKGKTNNIYNKLNLSIKIVPNKVNDIFYIKNENLIITPYITNFNGNILLYKPSEIIVKNNINNTVLVKTSKLSNKNIVVKSKYGNGELIILSDPNIFVNTLSPYNKKFLEYLIKNYNGNKIYFDESHRSTVATYDMITGSIYNMPNNFKYTILLLLGILIYFSKYLLLKLENILSNEKINLKKISKKYNIEIDNLELFVDKLKK